MKFHANGLKPQKDSGRPLSYYLLEPPSNGPKVSRLRLLIASELEASLSGNEKGPHKISIGRVGAEKKTLMLFPEKTQDDNRILVIGTARQPGHRQDGRVVESTGEMLFRSAGYGAWRSGEIFLAILAPGQYVRDNTGGTWRNLNGELEVKIFSDAEWAIETGTAQIDLI